MYEPVILHLEGQETLNFNGVVGRLREAERRFTDSGPIGSNATSDSAHSARTGPKDSGRKPRKGPKPPPGFKPGECWHCNSKDHKRPECPTWLRIPEGAKYWKESADKSAKASTGTEPAWITVAYSGTEGLDSDNWIVDSGASRHMTGDRSLF